MSLADVLASAPEAEAILTIDSAVSRAAIEADADALAQVLRASGVEPGAVVAVMLPNHPRLVAALFGVWRAGAVYAPLNPRSPLDEVRHNLDALRPAVVVTTADLVDRFDAARPVIVDRAGHWSTPNPMTTSAQPQPRHDRDVALLQFTSGTTGRPKPVPLRHGPVLDLIDRVLSTLRAKGSSGDGRAPMPNLVPVSLSVWAGLYQVLFAFRVGAPVVLMSEFTTTTFATLVARFGIRSTVLPPAAMTMLSDDETLTDLAPLRIVRSITAPLSPAQARRFHERFGVVVLNGYGQTELGGEVIGWSSADSREHGDSKLGSVGRPHRGVEVKIAEDGEVLVRTPATAAREIDAGLHDRLSDDGWFHTGDLGSFDDDGFVWIEGRVTDMINRGGLKVFPAQVEEVLLTAPGVRDAGVVAVPDERLGEVPWAFVVTDGPIEQGVLLDWCRGHLSPYKVPVRFVAVDALPRNEIGKLLRGELVDRAAQR